MDRSEAEQQAKCWTWWTGEETRADSFYNTWFWERRYHPNDAGGHWTDGPDLSGPGSPDLRRAIEARGWMILMGTQGPPRQWWCELWPPEAKKALRVHADSLEQALFRAALAAASGQGEA